MEPERFDLGDAVIWGVARTWDAQMTAYGSRDGQPHLASIDEDGRPCTATFPGTGRVSSVAGWERSLVTVEVDGSPQFYEVSTPIDGPLQIELSDEVFVPAPARLWVRCGDEEPGYLLVDPEGWLYAGDLYGAAWATASRALRAASPTIPLSVAMSEVAVYVGGLIARSPEEPTPSVWELWQDGLRQVAAHIVFDGISDISDGWAPCIAGHRSRHPVVVTAEGHLLPSPPVELAAESPTVLVATKHSDAGSDDRIKLVVQAVDGIQLWSRLDDRWQMQALPGDVLQAARYDHESSTLWFVTDNQLWHLPT